MKRYQVRFTLEAEQDLVRLHDFLAANDVDAASDALQAIKAAIRILKTSPYSCRKAIGSALPRLRELVVPFGKGGYVALFEIEERAVNIVAVRHQREDDYL